MARCIFCADWATDTPNCGHWLLDGEIVPANYLPTIALELGGEVAAYSREENTGSSFGRLDGLARRIQLAEHGGWPQQTSERTF